MGSSALYVSGPACTWLFGNLLFTADVCLQRFPFNHHTYSSETYKPIYMRIGKYLRVATLQMQKILLQDIGQSQVQPRTVLKRPIITEKQVLRGYQI